MQFTSPKKQVEANTQCISKAFPLFKAQLGQDSIQRASGMRTKCYRKNEERRRGEKWAA